MLTMSEVRILHGVSGDNCYVSQVCRSRRSHARHRYQRNETRRLKWYQENTGLNSNDSTIQPSAQLIVYRANRYNAPIDGIAAEVRQGKTKLAVVQPIYCSGLPPKQIYSCVQAILAALQDQYGILKFSGLVQQVPRNWQQFNSTKHRPTSIQEIVIQLPGITDSYSAVLVVYRDPATAAVVALATEIWKGATPEIGTPLLDCRGLLPSQIHTYISQVLAILGTRYGIRWFAQITQLSSEFCPLAAPAESAPSEAQPKVTLDLDPLWQELEAALRQHNLPCVQALEIAADGIIEIVWQFVQFAEQAFEELESVAEHGVMLPHDAFANYVRQSVEVDFSPFLHPTGEFPRALRQRSKEFPDDESTVIGELDQQALLQALDERLEMGFDEVEAFASSDLPGGLASSMDTESVRDALKQWAGQETPEQWTQSITQWMLQHEQQATLQQVQQSLRMPLVEVWLGALLGGYELFRPTYNEKTFYTAAIWIRQVQRFS